METKYPYPSFENTLVVPKSAAANATEALQKAQGVGYPYAYWNSAVWYSDMNDKPSIMYVQKHLTLDDLHQSVETRDWVWTENLMEPVYG